MPGRGLPSNSRGVARLVRRLEFVGSALPASSGALMTRTWALEIDGNALPSNSMPVQARLEKVTTANDVIKGVRRRLMHMPVIPLGGRKLTPDALVALYEAQLAAIERVRQAWSAYQQALFEERRLRKPMQAMTVHVKNAVMMELGPDGYPDFGWKTPKKPGPKTVKAKLAGVQKRAAKKRRG